MFPCQVFQSFYVIPPEQLAALPPGVADLVRDFGVESNGAVSIMDSDLNRPCLSFFINHGEQPNCEFVSDGATEWCETLRDIAAGEELFRDYRTDEGADYVLRGGG